MTASLKKPITSKADRLKHNFKKARKYTRFLFVLRTYRLCFVFTISILPQDYHIRNSQILRHIHRLGYCKTSLILLDLNRKRRRLYGKTDDRTISLCPQKK